MSRQRIDTRVLGVSQFDDAGGQGCFQMDLTEPVNVMYGLNGAGKSRLLRTVGAALGASLSVPGEALIATHLEVLPGAGFLDPASVMSDRSGSSLADELVAGLSRQCDLWDVAPELQSGWESSVTHLLVRRGIPSELAKVVAAQHHIVLVNYLGMLCPFIGFSFGEGVRFDSPLIGIAGPEALEDCFYAWMLEMNPPNWCDAEDEALSRFAQASVLHEANSAPAWMSYPLVSLQLDLRPTDIPVHVVTASQEDLLVELTSFAEESLGAGDVELDEEGRIACPQLDGVALRANELAQVLLPGLPLFTLDIRVPESLFQTGAVLIHCLVRGELLALDLMSRAQKQSISLAVRLALAEAPRLRGRGVFDRDVVVLLDEPDQSLHPQARRQLAAGILALAAEIVAPLVVATHAIELVAVAELARWHISRDGSGTARAKRLDRLTWQTFEGIGALGLSAADLIQFLRVLVVVEGRHDVAILEELFEDEFAAAGIHVLPIGGTHFLDSVLTNRMLFEYSEARVLVVLDHVSNPRLFERWAAAKPLAMDGKWGNAREQLQDVWTKARTPSKEEIASLKLL